MQPKRTDSRVWMRVKMPSTTPIVALSAGTKLRGWAGWVPSVAAHAKHTCQHGPAAQSAPLASGTRTAEIEMVRVDPKDNNPLPSNLAASIGAGQEHNQPVLVAHVRAVGKEGLHAQLLQRVAKRDNWGEWEQRPRNFIYRPPTMWMPRCSLTVGRV